MQGSLIGSGLRRSAGVRALLAGTVLALAGTAFVAPAMSAQDAEGSHPLSGKTIGVIYLTEAHPYYQAHSRWTKDYAEKNGINLREIDGRADAAVMTNAMEQFIAEGVDGIIFALLDPAAADPVINEAQAAGIPVVTFAIRHGENSHAPFVGIPEAVATEKAGIEAANRFQAAFPDTPARIVTVECPAIQSVVDRADGFIKGFTSVIPDAQILQRADGQCVREQAVIAMEDAIQAHPDVNVVYGGNGDSALGALAALQGANLGTSDKVLLVSHDGSEPEVLELVKPESALKLAIANRPRELSQATIDTLGEIVAGERPMNEDSDVLVEASVLLPDDVEALQSFLEEQYFSTVDLGS